MAPALSGVATAVFVVAITGVTLVVRRQASEDRTADRYRTYEDYSKFSRLDGDGAGGANIADNLILDVDEYKKVKSSSGGFYSYQQRSELGVDEDSVTVRNSTFQDPNYVPKYYSATGWYRLPGDLATGQQRPFGYNQGPEARGVLHAELPTAFPYNNASTTDFHGDPPVNRAATSLDDPPRQQKVKEMMTIAWDGYKRFAWGQNELRPTSMRAHSGNIFGSARLGATIVDSMDTLYLMGMHKDFDEGRDWIASSFTLDNVPNDLSVFETNIRFIGGFLTCYAFTGDRLFLEKAKYVADKLLPAFNTPTGIPYALINVNSGISKNYGWASGGCSILSEFGTLSLEFAYLSDITGDPEYRERIMTIRNVLKEIEKPKGLYPNYLNPKTGKWCQMHMSMGALGDSFYEYLLKAWVQSGQEDEEARVMYDEAMQAIIQYMIRTSPGGLMYVSDLKYDRLEHKMDHLACFAGGLFGLAAKTRDNQYSDKYMEIAEGLANTCHESYVRAYTRLGPEAFRFNDGVEAKALKSQEKYYILRPEVVETYFVMWRLTKNPKYREWGWDVVQALEKYCKTPNGYSGIKNVYLTQPQQDDVQQSFFLAETLKYLYLLFSDDKLLDLNQWVMNTEAHPMPIKGNNAWFRQAASDFAA